MRRAMSWMLGAVLMTTAGCHVTATTPPLAPGALNAFDQTSYTSLVTAKAVIDSFKASIAANPATLAPLTPIVNQAITDYNVAEAAWQIEHGLSTPSNQAAVTAALATLATDIANLQKASHP